jgi:hypothetical protein
VVRFVVLVAIAGLAVLGAAVSSGSASPAGAASGPSSTPSAVTTVLVTTVGVIESELTQLADGRAKLKSALGGVAACTVSPSVAASRLVEVIANRTGIAAQLATLPAPTAEAAHVKALLRSALDHSLAADRHYRDWVVSLETRPRCSSTANADLTAAQHEDLLATAAKKDFVAAFNALARRLHLRTWAAAAI